MKIVAKNKKTEEMFEVKDLYWFEEEGIHNFEDSDEYEFIFVVENGDYARIPLDFNDNLLKNRIYKKSQDKLDEPFIDKYSCKCGKQKGRIYHDIICNECNTKTRYKDDIIDSDEKEEDIDLSYIFNRDFYKGYISNYIFNIEHINKNLNHPYKIKDLTLSGLEASLKMKIIAGFIKSDYGFKPTLINTMSGSELEYYRMRDIIKNKNLFNIEIKYFIINTDKNLIFLKDELSVDMNAIPISENESKIKLDDLLSFNSKLEADNFILEFEKQHPENLELITRTPGVIAHHNFIKTSGYKPYLAINWLD